MRVYATASCCRQGGGKAAEEQRARAVYNTIMSSGSSVHPGSTGSRQHLQTETGITVCCEDDHLAIVWKPVGILTVGGTGRADQPSVAAALPSLFPAAPVAKEGRTTEGRLVEQARATLTDAAKALWLRKPGVGMQEMLSTIHAEFPQQAEVLGSRTAVKQLVRIAVGSIPYRRGPDDAGALVAGPAKISMIETLVAQRQAHRATREWTKADKLRVGLGGIGVSIDDKLKMWTLGVAPELGSTPVVTEPVADGRGGGGAQCAMCGAFYTSRNQLFKHLRDVTTSCGLTVAAAGGITTRLVDTRDKPTTTAATEATAVRLVLGPLVLPKSVAGMILVAKTAVGYKHAQEQLRESRVRLDWQAMVHGYFPQDGTCARVLQRSRGTHVQGGHLTLVETSTSVGAATNVSSGDQPFVQVLRALDSLGHPVVGDHSGKSRGLVSVAVSGRGTTPANDGRGGRGRGSTLLSLVGLRLPCFPDAAGPTDTSSLVQASHHPPARFAALVEREQTQWAKREREIARLQQAVAKASLALPENGPIDHSSRPLPPAYEVGATLFCGLIFQLGWNRAVMIPRPSTDALVRAAAAEITTRLNSAGARPSGATKRVLDLGCGSGNVLLSIMHYCQPPAGVQLLGVGMDLSVEATELSRANAAVLLSSQGQRSVKFVTGDFGCLHKLGPTEDRLGPFDVIVCNPPYLDQALREDLASVAPELLAEPPAALFAANSGTAAYTAVVASIAACQPPMLSPGAVLLFELGKGTALSVQAAIDNLGIIGCRCAVIEPPKSLGAALLHGHLDQVGLGRGYVLEVRGLASIHS